MSEILYGIIVILTSICSATIMHYIDKNHDNKIDKEEIEEAIMELVKKE